MPDRVFEPLGDRLTRALIGGDFDLYRSLMVLPLTVAPAGGAAYVLADEAAQRADFDLYHQVAQRHGVTDIFRQLRQVIVTGPDSADIHFVTHILAGATRLVDPFEGRFRLLRSDGDWCIAVIESTEGHIDWTLGRGRLGPGGFEPEGTGT